MSSIRDKDKEHQCFSCWHTAVTGGRLNPLELISSGIDLGDSINKVGGEEPSIAAPSR